MHNIKRFLGKRAAMALLLFTFGSTAIMGCSNNNNTNETTQTEQPATATASPSTETADYSNTIKGSEISVNYKDEDTNTDYKSSSYETITLSDSGIEYSGSNAKVSGQTITITSAGVYYVTGSIKDGQIIVEATKNDLVHIVLDNASITSSTGAAIYAKQSDKLVITLAEGSTNTLTDGTSYSYSDTENAPNACLYSADDISINGTGTLNVTGNYKDGIATKNDLKIVSGIINVTAADDGIRGKDSIAVKDGTITVTAGSDGLKSTNTTEDDKGYLLLEAGTFTITAGNDAIQAEKSLCVKGGTYTLTTNNGSTNAQKTHEEMMSGGMNGGFGNRNNQASQTTEATIAPETTASSTTETTTSTSYKAMKAGNDIYVTGGTFTIDSCDDAIHSNNTVTIDDGTFKIKAGDDAIHADADLTINNGTIAIDASYEGLEASNITINDGTITVVASDDGINAGGGTDSSQGNSAFGGDPFANTGDYSINFNGGTVTVTSEGDGIDSNGSIYQKGGTIYVNGTTNGGNGSLDYDTSYEISGGTLIAAGSTGMAQTTSDTSSQASIFVQYTDVKNANTPITLKDSSGKTVITYAPTTNYQCVVLSSTDIKTNETYSLYSGETKLCDIKPTSVVTCVTDSGETTTISQHGGGGGRGGNGDGGKFNNDGTGTRPERPDGAMDPAQTPSA
ncbi:MAG: carbohydrate-binding domain-containing protein [bacterium]|nr:carbohydrate-binding domain-containing protein [bacterium]